MIRHSALTMIRHIPFRKCTLVLQWSGTFMFENCTLVLQWSGTFMFENCTLVLQWSGILNLEKCAPILQWPGMFNFEKWTLVLQWTSYLYKVAIFVYRFFDGSLPGYLSQTLCAYEPTRNLRSSCEKLLKVPKHNTRTFGERSFSFLAPSVWNSLPSGLRNSSTLPLFKSRLKTHLFMTAFCQ